MKIEEKDWKTLLPRIKKGECTPFLGAAVNLGILPLGRDLAKELADEEGYPYDRESDKYDLIKVTQYLAIKYRDAVKPKDLVLSKLDKSQRPLDYNNDSEPLNILAKLPLPVYITTNYDNLLFSAIEHHGQGSGRKPAREICKWNSSLSVQLNHFKRGFEFRATTQTPVIFHLHGHISVVESLVLTEDDYLDFVINMSRNLEEVLPLRIQEALTGATVLFVGYRLADIDFRLLFRSLLGNLTNSIHRMNVAVQLPYDDAHPNKEKAEAYITKYFGKIEVRVYWGTARQFAKELWDRWRNFNV